VLGTCLASKRNERPLIELWLSEYERGKWKNANLDWLERLWDSVAHLTLAALEVNRVFGNYAISVFNRLLDGIDNKNS
jgi:hypothetical protein